MSQKRSIWNRDLVPDRWRPVVEFAKVPVALFWAGVTIYFSVYLLKHPQNFDVWSIVVLVFLLGSVWAWWPCHLVWR